MKRSINILLFLSLVTINLSAQIEYDTIPDEDEVIFGDYWEETVVFKDFSSQALTYFESIDFKNLECYGDKVFVATIFGKNGKLKNTRIVKSASPICDSIAFYFVNGLYGWLPGLYRGKFIDIPFVFPITFDSMVVKERYTKFDLFDVKEEEYIKRKEIFEFAFSDEYEQKIINDFDFFKKYMAETFRDSQYVHVLTDYRLKRKESIVLEFNIPKSKLTHLLVRDSKKDWILYEYSLNKGKVRVPGDKKIFMVFYKEGATPLLQTMMIYSEKDTSINLRLEQYTKGRLLDEIKKFSPK